LAFAVLPNHIHTAFLQNDDRYSPQHGKDEPGRGHEDISTRGESNENEGIYYLHADLPRHGQNTGNSHDVGDLLRVQPHENEERYCAKWVQFDFDEHVAGELTGDESLQLYNIYFHIWWKSANEDASIGVELHGYYDSHTEYSSAASHAEARTTVAKNGYWLTTGVLDVDYLQKDVHDLAVKVVSIDAIPSVFSGIDQYSFVILNLEEDSALGSMDRDADGIDDYDELFVHATNPYDADTDGDGILDLEETVEGADGIQSDPNNFDEDDDDLIDGQDPNPLKSEYKLMSGDWTIRQTEMITDDGLLVEGDIDVLEGGTLILQNAVLKMNQGAEQHRIRVAKGGTLKIENSRVVTDNAAHWYSMTLNTEHWHEERSIEALGTLVIRNSMLDYGSMIYIRDSNESVIEGNQILHYYYGIFSSHSTPTIKDNIISPFIGNGIFLWHSSPVIDNTIIETYIGTGISIYYSSPIIKNSYVSGGSNDFYLNGNSHPIVSNTTFNSNMVHIADEHSSLLVGTLESEDGGSGGSSKESVGPGVDPAAWGVIVILMFIVFITTMRKTSMPRNAKGSNPTKRKSGKKSTSRRNGSRSGSRKRKRK
jgi:parallel beta-helix repeat protein